MDFNYSTVLFFILKVVLLILNKCFWILDPPSEKVLQVYHRTPEYTYIIAYSEMQRRAEEHSIITSGSGDDSASGAVFRNNLIVQSVARGLETAL